MIVLFCLIDKCLNTKYMNRRNLLKTLGIIPFAPLNGSSKKPIFHSQEKSADTGSPTYDVVVYDATPGGVALSIRAAREGLKVLLVNHTPYLGGMFINGLGTMDTLYNGARAPLYDELRYNIYDYYRRKYSKASKQYEDSLPGFAKTKYESHVMKHIVEMMVSAEPGITVERGYYPYRVEKSGSNLTTVIFREMKGDAQFSAKGIFFADCSYEGDLAYISGTPMRIGRESRSEFGEAHAGITYMQKDHWPPPALNQEKFRLERDLNLFQYSSWSDSIASPDMGMADENIQAFNIRTTLTNDPSNRMVPGKPKKYDPEYLKKHFYHVNGMGLKVPNSKTSWNHPELVGEQNKYILGTWAEREEVTKKFREVTLALLYFKQNDPSVPEEERKKWKEYGLPKDEYADNGHMPYEVYVREGRRLVGLKTFTQHDASLIPGQKRAPIHSDSISVTEWFMDSHACTLRELPGSKLEGEVMLKNKTFPGQVALGTILTKDIENLIVPVCLSASHIGWGTIRLEPTWMSICEAAGYLLVLAKQKQLPPAKINIDRLLRLLAEQHIMISFFSDVEGREYSAWYPAIQYLGTKGYFITYEAKPEIKLTKSLADAWIALTKSIFNKKKEDLHAVLQATDEEEAKRSPVTAQEFAASLAKALNSHSFTYSKLLQILDLYRITPNQPITRGNACILIFEGLK